MSFKIGIFGCGNMGEALAFGFRSHSPDLKLFLFNPTIKKAEILASKVQGELVPSIELMPLDCDWYILAFKPQTLKDFHFNFKANSQVLSLLAGVGIKALEKKFQQTRLARLMPNTPSKLGLGANLFYSPFDSSQFIDYLECLGKVFVISSEDQLDKLTGISGSGPALIFEFAKGFFDNAILSGLDQKTSLELINQTFLGSVKLMENAQKEGISLAQLRDQVVSKKGVTYEALQTLEAHKFQDILTQAFNSAHARTIELKKEMDHA